MAKLLLFVLSSHWVGAKNWTHPETRSLLFGCALSAYWGEAAAAVRISQRRLDGVLWNQAAPVGALGRSMPAFGLQLSQAETIAMVKFLRARFSTQAPWKM
jgi:hypothetical protein